MALPMASMRRMGHDGKPGNEQKPILCTNNGRGRAAHGANQRYYALDWVV
jgi:hypothetical protein